MGTVLDSVDNMIASAQTNGMWHRLVTTAVAATTAATATSGGITAQRCPIAVIAPTPLSPLTNMYLTNVRMVNGATAVHVVCALDYQLGVLSVSTNAFSAPATMPSKTIRVNGTDYVINPTASVMPMLVATLAVTATTPVVTITYTNQDGLAGQTATLTLPTSPLVNTAFAIWPHLAAGDSGIQAVSNISISTGSAGTLRVWGLLPVGFCLPTGGQGKNLEIMPAPLPMFPIAGGERLSFYTFGSTAARIVVASLSGIADN